MRDRAHRPQRLRALHARTEPRQRSLSDRARARRQPVVHGRGRASRDRPNHRGRPGHRILPRPGPGQRPVRDHCRPRSRDVVHGPGPATGHRSHRRARSHQPAAPGAGARGHPVRHRRDAYRGVVHRPRLRERRPLPDRSGLGHGSHQRVDGWTARRRPTRWRWRRALAARRGSPTGQARSARWPPTARCASTRCPRAALRSGSLPGADGAMWFTDEGAKPLIGRIDPSGSVRTFSAGLPPGSLPAAITPGPDGSLWFTDEGSTAAIGRVTTSAPEPVRRRPRVAGIARVGTTLTCAPAILSPWSGLTARRRSGSTVCAGCETEPSWPAGARTGSGRGTPGIGSAAATRSPTPRPCGPPRRAAPGSCAPAGADRGPVKSVGLFGLLGPSFGLPRPVRSRPVLSGLPLPVQTRQSTPASTRPPITSSTPAVIALPQRSSQCPAT